MASGCSFTHNLGMGASSGSETLGLRFLPLVAITLFFLRSILLVFRGIFLENFVETTCVVVCFCFTFDAICWYFWGTVPPLLDETIKAIPVHQLAPNSFQQSLGHPHFLDERPSQHTVLTTCLSTR